MARWMPSPTEGNSPLLHPAFSLALVIAWIAASIAVISGLCASCNPKPSALSPKSLSPSEKLASLIQDGEQEQDQDQDQDGTGMNTTPTEEEGITELEAAIHGPIYPTTNYLPGSTSKRRLSLSKSINSFKEGLLRIKTKKEKIGVRGGGEESLWKKTIILGDKCRMQNEEVEGGEQSNGVDGDTTKMPRSNQASRNTSFA